MEQLKEYGPMMQSAASAVGTVVSARGEAGAGISADKMAEYRAAQMEQNAKQEGAVGSVAAAEEQRKADLLASRAIAVAAASGASSLDPSVIRIIQGIKGQGALNAATELYNSRERARGMTDQAGATRYEGKQYRAAGKAKAINTVLAGVSKLNNTWGDEPAPGSGYAPLTGREEAYSRMEFQ